MRHDPPPVRLVSVSLERSSPHNIQSHPTGTCKDAKCTDALVLDIVAAVDIAAAAFVDLEGVLSLSLAKQIADIVIVSLALPTRI